MSMTISEAFSDPRFLAREAFARAKSFGRGVALCYAHDGGHHVLMISLTNPCGGGVNSRYAVPYVEIVDEWELVSRDQLFDEWREMLAKSAMPIQRSGSVTP